MQKLPELSIFFPFWNEEKNIEKVTENAVSVVKNMANKWEILLIDDGSTDKTLEKAKNLARKFENVKVFSHQPNRGYGAALREGLTNAKYDYIVFTDGDGQFDFSEIGKFAEKIGKYDMVIGYRIKRKDNSLRHILMYMLKLWDFVFFRFYFKDIDCGFKMFKKETIDQLMPLRSEGAMITTEILAKAKYRGFSIGEVEVSHYPRKYGYQSGGNIFVITRAVLESFTLWLDIINGRF